MNGYNSHRQDTAALKYDVTAFSGIRFGLSTLRVLSTTMVLHGTNVELDGSDP